MTGYTTGTFTTAAGMTVSGVCTDIFEATGQTGRDPPQICGTNTGYHSKKSLRTIYSVPIYHLDICNLSVRGVWSSIWRHHRAEDNLRGHQQQTVEHSRQTDCLHLRLEVRH